MAGRAGCWGSIRRVNIKCHQSLGLSSQRSMCLQCSQCGPPSSTDKMFEDWSSSPLTLIPPTAISWKLPSSMVFLMSLNREASKLGGFPKWKMERSTKTKHTVSFELWKGNLLPLHSPETKKIWIFSASPLSPSRSPPLLSSFLLAYLPPSFSLLLHLCPSIPTLSPFFSFKLLEWLNDFGSNAQIWQRFISTLCRSQYPIPRF